MVQVLSQEGLGDMLGKSVGSGISSGLQMLMQSKIDKMTSQSKFLENLPKEMDSNLKAMGLGDVYGYEDRVTLSEKISDKVRQGMKGSDAMQLSITEMQEESPAQKSTVDQRQQIFDQMGSLFSKGGTDASGTKGGEQGPKSTVDQRQTAFEERGSPIREPKAFLTGVAENPLLNLLRSFGSPEMSGTKLLEEGFSGLTNPTFGKSAEETTERAKKTREFGNEVGRDVALSFIPLGSAAKLLKKPLGKVLGRMASKLKLSPEVIGKQFTEFAKKEGIDFAKLQQKDPTESRKLLKVARAFEENAPRLGEELAVREELAAAGKKASVKKDVKLESSRVSQRKSSKKGSQKVKDTGKTELAKAKADHLRTTKERRAIEDSIKMKDGKYNKKDLSRVKALEKEQAKRLKKSSYKARRGKAAPDDRSTKLSAFNVTEKVREIAKSGDKKGFKVIQDSFGFKDPVKVKELSSVGRKVSLPEVGTDAFVKQNKNYADVFMKRLGDIEKRMPTASHSEIMTLNKEREMLTDLLKKTRNKMTLGKRRISLQKIDKMIKTQEKISKSVDLENQVMGKIEKAIQNLDVRLPRSGKTTNPLKGSSSKKATGPKKSAKLPLGEQEKLVKGLLPTKDIPKWKKNLSKAARFRVSRKIREMFLKKNIDIPSRTITQILAATGVPVALLSGVPAVKSAGKFAFKKYQINKMRTLIKNNDRKGLTAYQEKLRADGYSRSRIKKLMDKARGK